MFILSFCVIFPSPFLTVTRQRISEFGLIFNRLFIAKQFICKSQIKQPEMFDDISRLFGKNSRIRKIFRKILKHDILMSGMITGVNSNIKIACKSNKIYFVDIAANFK